VRYLGKSRPSVSCPVGVAGSNSDVTCPSSFSRSQAICRDHGQLSPVCHPRCCVADVAQCMCRGKPTCGDIDVMITRSPDDGRTHAGTPISRSRQLGKKELIYHCRSQSPGILPKLLSALHSAGIITEDLSLSSDANDNLECTYRGLCIHPARAGQDKQPTIRRRIGVRQRLVTGTQADPCWRRHTRHPLGESGGRVDIFHGTSPSIVHGCAPKAVLVAG